MAQPLVLVVHGDTAVREAMERTIQKAGCAYRGAVDTKGAFRILEGEPVQIALVDAGMETRPLEKFLTFLGEIRPGAVAVGLGRGLDDPGAGQLLKKGLFDLVPNPLVPGRMALVLERTLEQVRIRDAYRRLRNGNGSYSGFQRMVGGSSFMENLRANLERLSCEEGPVLFSGPAGTGRELSARYMHSISPRGLHPFHSLDCSTFPAEALEAELFGRGARQGLLAPDMEGSVFLGEVVRLSLPVQVRLEEVLGKGTNRCRVLASSSLDLSAVVRDGRFREGLLEQVAGSIVVLEPLNRRTEDIPMLANDFIDTICRINDLPPISLSAAVLELLVMYPWPGNIRELRNAMEQAAILATGTVQPEDLPARIRGKVQSDLPDGSFIALEPFRAAKKKVVEAFEARYLSELMSRKQGNVTAAAEQAGMLRSALQRLLRKHNIRSAEYRKAQSGRTGGAVVGKLPVD